MVLLYIESNEPLIKNRNSQSQENKIKFVESAFNCCKIIDQQHYTSNKQHHTDQYKDK